MGVVHKLTAEVIQFILDQKKEKPSLGCRKLSEMISEKFSCKVSKSSVNSVLKAHELSGSVGRPSSPPSKEKKFRIPDERKKQLFNREAKTFVEPDKPKAGAETASNEPARPQPVHSPKHDGFLENIEMLREKERQGFGAQMANLGAVFVHAAVHELGLAEMAAKLLYKQASTKAPEGVGPACSALILLNFLGIQDENEFVSAKTQVVWGLNGENAKEPARKLWNLVSTTEMSNNFKTIVLNEIEQQRARIKCFKIALDDGEHLLFDSRLSILGRGEAGVPSPIAGALGVLSEKILSNNKPAVIKSLSSEDDAQKNLRLLASVFCRVKPAIKRADVIGADGKKITEFSLAPRNRRNFIIGIDAAHQQLFRSLEPSLKWGSFTPWYAPDVDLVCYYAEIEPGRLEEDLGLDNDLARAVAFSFFKEEKPATILISNMKGVSSEAILNQYLGRWPAHKNDTVQSGPGTININEVNNTFYFQDNSKMAQIFDLISQTAFNYARSSFFNQPDTPRDVNVLSETLCSLQGKLSTKDKLLKIMISPPQKDQVKSWLNSASIRVNQSGIYDQGRRKLVILAEN